MWSPRIAEAETGALWLGLVACDETGVSGRVVRRHGRSPRGGDTVDGESITRSVDGHSRESDGP